MANVQEETSYTAIATILRQVHDRTVTSSYYHTARSFNNWLLINRCQLIVMMFFMED